MTAGLTRSCWRRSAMRRPNTGRPRPPPDQRVARRSQARPSPASLPGSRVDGRDASCDPRACRGAGPRFRYGSDREARCGRSPRTASGPRPRARDTRTDGSRAVTNASNAIMSGWRHVPRLAPRALGELDGLAGAPALRTTRSATPANSALPACPTWPLPSAVTVSLSTCGRHHMGDPPEVRESEP